MSEEEIVTHPNKQRLCFYADSVEDITEWVSILCRCTLPFEFLRPCSPPFSYTGETFYDGSDEHNLFLTPLPKINGSSSSALSLTDVSYPYRRALLWKKLRICALHFDFLKPDEQARRNVKRDALADVLDTVRKQP